MRERRAGFGTIAIATLAMLTATFSAPTAARAAPLQRCVRGACQLQVFVLSVWVCLAYQETCTPVGPAHCRGMCRGRVQTNDEASTTRVTITPKGRALGFTPANLSTFRPPGMTTRTPPAVAHVRAPASGNRGPIGAGNRLTGGGNKLTPGTKTPSAPLTAAGASTPGGANTSLLKKH